ncbi:uncharacterized protein [Rutidosis leptorrhynchoides]|uniref:uncharacterized protein n=1 Tax=Rutidosis leptorrhynchoides TaxID=125765 RepID=UPI003A99903F
MLQIILYCILCFGACMNTLLKVSVSLYIICTKVLASCLDQLLLESCPFNKLKCLKINTMLVAKYGWSPGKREQFLNQLKNYFIDKSPSATFITDYPQVPRKRPMQKVHDDAMANKLAKSGAEIKQPDTVSKDKRILEAQILMQDQVATKHKEMFESEIEMQYKVPQKRSNQQVHDNAGANTIITRDKEILDANIQMQDQVISKQNAMFEAHIQMQDKVITKQKMIFEAKMQMQDNVIAEQKAKIQMLEVVKLEYEKLMSYVMKSKIAELQVQVESGNPDFEVIRSIGSETKSVMEMIPESLKAVMKAQFSFEYVQWKSLFLTRIDATQWSKIETEMGIIDGL